MLNNIPKKKPQDWVSRLYAIGCAIWMELDSILSHKRRLLLPEIVNRSVTFAFVFCLRRKRKAIMNADGRSIPKLNETNGQSKFVSYANYVNLPKKLKYFYFVAAAAAAVATPSTGCSAVVVVLFHLRDARRRRRRLRNVKDESVNAD